MIAKATQVGLVWPIGRAWVDCSLASEDVVVVEAVRMCVLRCGGVGGVGNDNGNEEKEGWTKSGGSDQ